MSYEIGGTWEENFDGITMQCAGVVEDGNVIAAAFDEDFYIAKERASTIASCMNDRDTYRDLCAELLKAAHGYVPYMPTSTAKEGGANRHSGMLRASDNLKDAIAKAEKILGEKNGNAN